ncbi:MAG TPA: homoserine dehydrogenase [Terriglobales bacterium]|nr:homoserine dehydrogenase [Terriglobales bacterium]
MATALLRSEGPQNCAQREFRVALLGFGTVGSAVARLLHARRDELGMRLTHICNRNVARKKASWNCPHVLWTENVQQVLRSDADVVVELIGGLEPAHDIVRRALVAGKSVVTANKQLIARFGSELSRLADENGQYLGFGACVAGGVPVLSALQDGLAGDRLTQVSGILNGTCNYILTRVEQSGIGFAEALREAQQRGFAEADPTDDVDGHDSAAKLAILARVGLKLDVSPTQVARRSIRDITAIDFAYARELGCTIRQISTAKLHDGKVYMAVEPSLVPVTSPFGGVVGSQNLVVSSGEFGGDTTLRGHGAGGDPTAVAVISDLLQASRSRSNGCSQQHCTVACKVSNDFERRHYLRFVVRDRPGIIAAIASVLSRYHINLDAVLQKPGLDKSALPFVITLESCRQSQLESALREIKAFDFLAEAPIQMPILK